MKRVKWGASRSFGTMFGLGVVFMLIGLATGGILITLGMVLLALGLGGLVANRDGH